MTQHIDHPLLLVTNLSVILMRILSIIFITSMRNIHYLEQHFHSVEQFGIDRCFNNVYGLVRKKIIIGFVQLQRIIG